MCWTAPRCAIAEHHNVVGQQARDEQQQQRDGRSARGPHAPRSGSRARTAATSDASAATHLRLPSRETFLPIIIDLSDPLERSMPFVKPPASTARAARPMLALWLDLRGKSVANDLTALLDLYGGVRKSFDKAGQPPPQGSAVTGVLHLLRDLEKDEEDGDDGGLSLLALDGDVMYLDSAPAGVSITAGQSKSKQNAAANEAIRKEERLLLLLGAEQAVLPLFEFSLAEAQRYRSTSLADGLLPRTALLAEVRGKGGVRAVQRAEREDDAAVPLGIVLGPDPALWYMALST